jgi:photosystem II stability/assembly factor-like uncharacterized protein
MIRRIVTFSIFLCAISGQVVAQSTVESIQGLHYRMIGPFRAGRTVGAVGIPSQPNVFFMGVNNGGVWKTDDYGRTWKPIFDKNSTGSIGDVAVSPSDPNIIYVGTGEGLHRPDLSVGDGMFKSSDGGKSWAHIGLDDVQQIGRVVVHPTNPEIVFAAGLGHPYGANEMRGVFRSQDGGRTWQKVLYINNHTGCIQVEFDPSNPTVLFADMWEHQEGPWENASFSGSNSGLYKSIDGGTTWKKLEKGLPGAAQGLGRIGIAIAPNNSKRVYATVDARQDGGIYRSDDAGENWALVTRDGRLWGRGSDFAEIKIHPTNQNVLFIANVASYKSTDGGKSWTSIKGAPGGDDYHRIWINPRHPDIMIFAADQGATITVNGGKTWSSWYNQPTAQLYHVSTDNQFPYMVYGGQQESGAIGVMSRGPGGQISFRDWMGVGADEYAYVAPDPKNPDIVYGRVIRFNKKTGQSQNVAPEALRSGKYRGLRTLPLLFNPSNPDQLLFGTNVLWSTTNGGQSWEIISPDLTRKQPEVPASVGDFKTDAMSTMPQRAVIYSVAPSHLDKNIIWAGTDDGLVHLSVDGGKTWKDVTPPSLASWDKISQIDAGHFDKATAYISVNAMRKDDQRPHIYRTSDSGATWKEIVNGMHSFGPVNAVREDVKQPGLLFAGTEREVYCSTDNGDRWFSLRLNMPATSIRDLVVHENDLVIGTHGRSIWILDDFSPLREMATASTADAHLFTPSLATRVRYNMFLDTPLPPEEPTGQNPPDGVAIDYFLGKGASDVKVDILDGQGVLVRSYSSKDMPEKIDTTRVGHPTYWFRPAQKVNVTTGHHRIHWDLRYTDPRNAERGFAIAAVYHNTPSGPQGPYVHPGTYTVRLTVDGKVQQKPVVVRLDPRVTLSDSEVRMQTDLSMAAYNGYHELQSIREAMDIVLADPKKKWKPGQKEALAALRGNGDPDGGDFLYGSITESALEKESVVSLQHKMLYMVTLLQSADAKPTAQASDAVSRLKARAKELADAWAKAKK